MVGRLSDFSSARLKRVCSCSQTYQTLVVFAERQLLVRGVWMLRSHVSVQEEECDRQGQNQRLGVVSLVHHSSLPVLVHRGGVSKCLLIIQAVNILLCLDNERTTGPWYFPYPPCTFSCTFFWTSRSKIRVRVGLSYSATLRICVALIQSSERRRMTWLPSMLYSYTGTCHESASQARNMYEDREGLALLYVAL